MQDPEPSPPQGETAQPFGCNPAPQIKEDLMPAGQGKNIRCVTGVEVIRSKKSEGELGAYTFEDPGDM